MFFLVRIWSIWFDLHIGRYLQIIKKHFGIVVRGIYIATYLNLFLSYSKIINYLWVWIGLRGAMAFALALQSVHDLPEGHGQTIFTATTAIVVLSVGNLTFVVKLKFFSVCCLNLVEMYEVFLIRCTKLCITFQSCTLNLKLTVHSTACNQLGLVRKLTWTSHLGKLEIDNQNACLQWYLKACALVVWK